MVDRRVAGLGGVSGTLYIVSFIPAYVVGHPDAPLPPRTGRRRHLTTSAASNPRP
jgi:hypothetical protein